jgi:hypothetical protein
MSIEQDQIPELRRQQRFHIEQYDLHKATIEGNSLWPVSAESDASLRAELEVKAAEQKAEYDRLEGLIQAAQSAPQI